MPLVGQGHRPATLCWRASRPQLKRDPLGGSQGTSLTMTTPIWPDWALLQSYNERVWAVVHEHLAGSEEFESAATRIATIIRDRMQDPRCDRPKPSTSEASADRPVWMIALPVPPVGDADTPRVSRLFERATELYGRAIEEGAA